MQEQGAISARAAVQVRPEGGRRRWRRVGVWVLGLLGVWLAGQGVLRLTPLPAGLGVPPAAAIELVDRRGRSLRQWLEADRFHQGVGYSEIPAGLIEATLAAEDKRFWRHGGVDGWATARAAWGYVRHRRVVSGGSTISQQVIKLTERRPRTVGTKLVEAMQALRLEQVWYKPRILTEYLNRLDYGNLTFGCAAAARFYFGRSLADLTVAEMALLAGIPQAPSRLDPHRHFAAAQKRQRWILGRMRANGSLSEDEYRRACEQPLKLAEPRRPFAAPHYVDFFLREEGARVRRSGPGVVRTSLDLELNERVEEVLRRRLGALAGQGVREGAVVVLANTTGEVLALVGSPDYFGARAGQVNGAWAKRSAGSTLKPFTYWLAFERGATPASMVADLPTELPTSTGLFRPTNYDRRCYGPMRYRMALANSLNISAVKVLKGAGGPEALRQRLIECGLTTLTESAAHYGLGLTLGNAEVRLLELVNAYATLARLGEFKPWRLVPAGTADIKSGNSAGLVTEASERRQLGDAGMAWWIADILRDNGARSLAFGVDSDLRFPFPVAVKTGTSSEFRDNWAVGYTPEFTVGVWVGNFDATPMAQVSGVTGAAPILQEVLVDLHAREGTSWFAPPVGWVAAWVDPLTGRREVEARGGSVAERFPADRLPPLAGPEDRDEEGRVRLPREYAEWLASGQNWLGSRAVLDSRETRGALRILTPLPGTRYFLDPDLPEEGRWLGLRGEGGSAVRWASPSLELRRSAQGTWARLEEGRHALVLEDGETGDRRETWIRVERR